MNLKKILTAVVVIYTILSVVEIGTPWLRNKMFENDMDSLARSLNYQTVETTRRSLMEAAVSDKVPITEEQLVVVKDFSQGIILLEAKYSVVASTPFDLYTRTWAFNPRVQMRLAKDATRD